jgi:hypothetical protein
MPLGSPVDVTVRLVVEDPTSVSGEPFRVMLHFLDIDGEMLWADDHEPPTPTTQWRAGQTIDYTKTVFIPLVAYSGPAIVEFGLYSPKDGRRAVLHGEDLGQRGYKVGTLQLQPQTDAVYVSYKDGWHNMEVADGDANIAWQWTKREGIVSFLNPKRDILFYLALDGSPQVFDTPQTVQVLVGEQEVDRFLVDRTTQILRKIPISGAALGAAETAEVRIRVDKWFVPRDVPSLRSQDPRELGVRVFHTYVALR